MGQLLDPTPSDQPFVVCLAQLAQASRMGQLANERFRTAQHADGARAANLLRPRNGPPARWFTGGQWRMNRETCCAISPWQG